MSYAITNDDWKPSLLDKNTLEHYGVKGMKWGVRRTDAELARARARRKQKVKDAGKKTKDVAGKPEVKKGAVIVGGLAGAAVLAATGNVMLIPAAASTSKQIYEGYETYKRLDEAGVFDKKIKMEANNTPDYSSVVKDNSRRYLDNAYKELNSNQS